MLQDLAGRQLLRLGRGVQTELGAARPRSASATVPARACNAAARLPIADQRREIELNMGTSFNMGRSGEARKKAGPSWACRLSVPG